MTFGVIWDFSLHASAAAPTHTPHTMHAVCPSSLQPGPYRAGSPHTSPTFNSAGSHINIFRLEEERQCTFLPTYRGP